MTYGWVFHAKLATLMDKLVRTNSVPHSRYIFINVLIRPLVGLQDLILFTLGIASDLPFFATFTLAKLRLLQGLG